MKNQRQIATAMYRVIKTVPKWPPPANEAYLLGAYEALSWVINSSKLGPVQFTEYLKEFNRALYDPVVPGV